MQLVYQSIFDLSPSRFLDIRVEMIVPAAVQVMTNHKTNYHTGKEMQDLMLINPLKLGSWKWVTISVPETNTNN